MVLQRTILAGPSRVAVVATLAVLSTSCGAGWQRPKQLEPGTLAPRQHVQVWSGGIARGWHAVRVGPDSISGIPFFQPTTCDSCRIALPRAVVDSVRLGDPIEGFWKSTAVVLSGFTLLLIYLCARGCGGT